MLALGTKRKRGGPIKKAEKGDTFSYSLAKQSAWNTGFAAMGGKVPPALSTAKGSRLNPSKLGATPFGASGTVNARKKKKKA